MLPRFAFVGCYSGFAPGQLGWVGSKHPGVGILSFAFNSADGSLSPTGRVRSRIRRRGWKSTPTGASSSRHMSFPTTRGCPRVSAS